MCGRQVGAAERARRFGMSRKPVGEVDDAGPEGPDRCGHAPLPDAPQWCAREASTHKSVMASTNPQLARIALRRIDSHGLGEFVVDLGRLSGLPRKALGAPAEIRVLLPLR